MAETVYNRYRNDSPVVETFFVEGKVIRMVPGGTAVAPAGSTVAKSRYTVIVQRNVQLDNFEDLEDTSWEEQEAPNLQAPEHENTNVTNTRPADGRTILTDEFDGSGGTGAVNTSAARLVTEGPETPKPNEAEVAAQLKAQAEEKETKSGSRKK